MPSYSFAGSKNSPYLRLLPPAYGDGVFLPRYSHLARRVSSKLSFYFFQGRKFATKPRAGLPELSSLTATYHGHNHEGNPPQVLSVNEHCFSREGEQNDTESKTNTHMVMQWGQVSIDWIKFKVDLAPSSLTTTSSPPAKQPLTAAIQKSSE